MFRRLVWLTLLRIALVSVLLAGSAALVLQGDDTQIGQVEQALFSIILGTYSASLVYLLVLRGARAWHLRLAYAQVLGDVLIAACMVWLTGGAESILVFLFPLAVVISAVLLGRRGAVGAAALSSLGLTFVSVGLNGGWLPSPSAGVLPLPLPRLSFFLFAQTSGIFLSAALASYLAEQLQATRERLTRSELDYLALEQLHESIVRSISSGLITVDREGRVTFLNGAAERLCGFSLAHVRGEPAEKRLPALAGALGASGPRRFEAEHVAAGVTRRLGFALAPLYDREGQSHGHVIAVEDLTGIRAMEESLRKSEQLAVVGAMAAGLAHELRNPLASMTGSVQLLCDGRSGSADEHKLMHIVLREADRLNTLVSDFLQFARPQPNQVEPVDLRDVVGTTLTLFRNDPARRQVVMEVADDGPGIAAKDLPHVFEPFFTTKASGTGLGLAIVDSIIRQHGGEVQVRSAPGKGTAFCVRLPARTGS